MSNPQHSPTGTATSPLARLERMVDDWFHTLPGRHTAAGGGVPGEDTIRVDEYRDGDTQVVRAEVPGIDPERDVDISIADGMLRISAERRIEEDTVGTGWTRNELRYGTFSRSLPLPGGANPSDITATYRNGILEIRIPVNEPAAAAEPVRIPVRKG
jgi:HSP20 family protein